jgi:hypothetical protein
MTRIAPVAPTTRPSTKTPATATSAQVTYRMRIVRITAQIAVMMLAIVLIETLSILVTP